MQTRTILKMVGILISLFSATMLLPAGISLIYKDGGGLVFFRSFLISLLMGFLLYYPNRKGTRELKNKSGFVIVILFWIVLGAIGAIPFMLAKEPELSVTDSFFESFSALTTTGATLINDLESLPKSILMYRHLLQWLGGMGIIVLAVAILPLLGIGGMQLYRAETPGPVKDNKITPRIAETAKVLWNIYLTLTVVCAIAYKIAGMDWFDAIGHSFSTISIGGFSSHDESLAYFDNTLINYICVFFLLISAINFNLHFIFFASKKISIKTYYKDAEVKFFIFLQLIISAICVIALIANEIYNSNIDAINDAIFQAVSISTTAGFTTTSFSSWPLFLPALLMMSSFIGGCAGSTGGGLKVIRILLLMLQSAREIKRLTHPRALFTINLGNKAISERVIDAIWGFFSAYIFIYIICNLSLLATGLDMITAISATAACLNNLGPALGQAAMSYSSINEPAKWILIFAMLCGRLEVFTLLVIISPTFWKK